MRGTLFLGVVDSKHVFFFLSRGIGDHFSIDNIRFFYFIWHLGYLNSFIDGEVKDGQSCIFSNLLVKFGLILLGITSKHVFSTHFVFNFLLNPSSYNFNNYHPVSRPSPIPSFFLFLFEKPPETCVTSFTISKYRFYLISPNLYDVRFSASVCVWGGNI